MYIALGIAGFIILVIIIIFNSLVSRKNQVENAFASIDVYLKKRADLIPSLVEAVKGYMKHEKEVLTQITELRQKAKDSNLGSNERVDIENGITAGLGKLMVAVEAYPDLKASEIFMQLQRSVNEQEAQLAAARRAFNASVTDYNNAVESFPSNMIAKMMGYSRKNVFTIPEVSREAMDKRPEVNL